MTSSRVRKEVDEALYAFVDRQRPVLLGITEDLAPMLGALDSLLSGGKRLRPAFCYWGWRGAGGADCPEILTASASLELLQASALIHDGAGRYLLHLRDDREGMWEPWVLALVGGKRSRDDASLEATLQRELAEEVPGMVPTELVPFAVQEATSADGLAVPISVYAGRWSGDAGAVDLREGVLLTWCTVDMLDRLRGFADSGRGVIVVLHELSHAARIADDVLLLKAGGLLAHGLAADVLRPETLSEAYGIGFERHGPAIVPVR